LCLRGISTGDFQEALAALLGKDAPNLSPSVIARLKSDWQAECMLVVIGATPEGKKELVGFQVGTRESAQSWRELLVGLKARGLTIAPELVVGDGALGFWKALEEVFPATRHQRCWIHKAVNVLNKLPKSLQANARQDLREIWLAPDRATAEAAIATFAAKYAPKYDRAVAGLVKDREALLAFYDFPAEHWGHLRSSNPIESVFATVRHRTMRTKDTLSQETARLMVFKLVMAAARTWRRLKGENPLPEVIEGVIFKDGVEVTTADAQDTA
jgi:putative transposase